MHTYADYPNQKYVRVYLRTPHVNVNILLLAAAEKVYCKTSILETDVSNVDRKHTPNVRGHSSPKAYTRLTNWWSQ